MLLKEFGSLWFFRKSLRTGDSQFVDPGKAKQWLLTDLWFDNNHQLLFIDLGF